MSRPTDKQLLDAIERNFGRTKEGALVGGSLPELVAYAQLRELTRIADNLFNLTATLAVLRADLAKREPT